MVLDRDGAGRAVSSGLSLAATARSLALPRGLCGHLLCPSHSLRRRRVLPHRTSQTSRALETARAGGAPLHAPAAGALAGPVALRPHVLAASRCGEICF